MPSNYILVNVIGLSISLFLLWKIAQRTANWLTYAHLFSFFWGANLLISQIAMDGLLKPEIPTLIILYGAWWAFLLGSLLVIRKQILRKRLNIPINRLPAIIVLIALVGMQVVAYLYEMATLRIGPIEYFKDIFSFGAELRLTSVYAAVKYPFSMTIWRWDHILYIPLAIFLNYWKIISKKALISIFILSFILSWGRFTRAPFVQLIIIIFISWITLYMPDKKIRILVCLSLATLVLLSFVVTQNILTDRNSQYLTIAPNESLFGYIGASPMAYESLIKGYYPKEESGYYSLEAINFVLYKLAVINDYPGLQRPYAAMPFETNVYTFLDVFTLDWGVALAIVGSLLTGAAVAWIYKKMCFLPDYANVTIYCYLVYCCVMAIANNEFIRVSVPINIILAVIIGIVIRSRKGNVR